MGRPCMALVMRTEKWSEDVVREDPLRGEHGGHAAGPWPPRPFPGSGLGLPSLACGCITEVPVFAWDPVCLCPAVHLSGRWSVLD